MRKLRAAEIRDRTTIISTDRKVRAVGWRRLRDPELRTAEVENHAETFEETDAQKTVARKPHPVFKQQHRPAAESIGVQKSHRCRL